jgi:hypothetical protein
MAEIRHLIVKFETTAELDDWTDRFSRLPAIFATVRAVAPTVAQIIPEWPLPLINKVSAACRVLSAAVDTSSEKTDIRWDFGLPIDRDTARDALADFNDDGPIPVHHLVAFNFTNAGFPVPGTATNGLKFYVGQEVIGFPQREAQRSAIARYVVRLAHDMLTSGPWAEGSRTLDGFEDDKVLVQSADGTCRLTIVTH